VVSHHGRETGKVRGPVTPTGKAHSAAAMLRHGFYSRARDKAMIALGEDPKEYRGLLQSLLDDLEPGAGLQSELVLRMARALWRMQRAERMQDGLAVKRAQNGLQMAQLAAAPSLLENRDLYERLCAIGQMMNRPAPPPTPAEIEALVGAFGNKPLDDVQKLFPLVRSFGEAASKAPWPPNGNDDLEPTASSPEAQESKSLHQQLRGALTEVATHYLKTGDLLMEMYDKTQSPENIAALMAPKNESSMFMQRMEDSNLRQLWRLTKMFLMVKRARGAVADDESPVSADYVDENKVG
jgi:hypothetical protein